MLFSYHMVEEILNSQKIKLMNTTASNLIVKIKSPTFYQKLLNEVG